MSEEKELNISFFLKELLQKEVMAHVLDLARVSDMGERQFEQFERSVKDHIYSIIKNGNDRIITYTKFTTSFTKDVLPMAQRLNESHR